MVESAYTPYRLNDFSDIAVNDIHADLSGLTMQ